MSDNPQPIQVTITAQIKGLMDGLTAATAGVKASTAEMAGSFEKLAAVVNGLKAPFLAITAVLGGGALFKSAITDTVNWTMEVNQLSKAMAINMEQASSWAVMLHTLGISSDTMTGVMQRLQVRMNTGGKAFQAYGIATKDANGAIKPTSAVLEEIIGKYQTLGTQSEKNAMLAALFGRAWLSVLPLMRATSERLADAAIEAHNLGLEVGPDGVAKARAYTEGMNGLHLIMLAFGNNLGKTLLPVLASFTRMVGTEGPNALGIMNIAIKGLVGLFYDLYTVVKTVLLAIDIAIQAVGQSLTTLVLGAYKAATGDFKGAWEAIKGGFGKMADQVAEDSHGIVKAWTDDNARIKALWATTKLAPEPADGPPGASPNTGKVKGEKVAKDETPAIITAFKNELTEKKNAEANWFTWSVAQEISFWQQKLECTVQGSKLSEDIELELGKLKRKQAEQGEAALKTDADDRIRLTLAGSAQRIALEQTEAARLKGIYGEDSKEYKAAQERVLMEQQHHAQQMIEVDKLIEVNHQDAALEGLDVDLQAAQEAESNGLITKQKLLAAETIYEQKKYQIQLKAAQDEAALEPDPAKHQELLNRIEALERSHATRMAQIASQGAQQQRQTFDKFFQGMTSGFSSAISGMIRGTETWGQAFKSILSSMTDFLVQESVSMMMKWVADRLYEMIFGKATRTAGVLGASSQYAVNAMASAAAIPITGWAMAPGVGAAAMALGMSFMPSASGGWERVPATTLAMLHTNEMVLPASVADKVRNGAGGEHSSGPVTVYFNGVVDAKSFFQQHQGAIVSTIKGAVNNRRF